MRPIVIFGSICLLVVATVLFAGCTRRTSRSGLPTLVPTQAAAAAAAAEPVTPTVAAPAAAAVQPVTPTVAAAAPVTPTVAPAAPVTPTVAAAAPVTPTVAAATPVTPTAALNPAFVGLPAGIVAASATADATRGQQLTVKNACNACHGLAKDQRIVGPSWYDLANTAATRVPGESAAVYIYNSISNPNGFVVPTYPANTMIQTFAKTLSDQDFADIITYLLSLKAQ